ncbi:hypothetical protein HYPSUDRAFT_1041995 [Hypholoma sublateritium FD-334 SS-4]|uniref:Uncharacterized protein n=1 Tax=Hypholoma sublateritium (strain FD-334 SS-4) TaxID=945553 RepID=A0A0D2PA94_HYPSF|nr:hypothetical protein HYPSUDRAFT_1041995 [Hypholoma sublateritium FD-334 SS-4]
MDAVVQWCRGASFSEICKFIFLHQRLRCVPLVHLLIHLLCVRADPLGMAEAADFNRRYLDFSPTPTVDGRCATPACICLKAFSTFTP